jgi:oxysterol-binding protein-related protein 9/10/11
VNLEKLNVIPKKAPPMESQLSTETQKVWEDVTSAIHAREFSKANKAKQTIEAKQRRDAAARKERNEEWVPKYFKMEGTELRPELTEEGENMLQNIYMDN